MFKYTVNPSGYILFESEHELYRFLETTVFPKAHPKTHIKKQVEFAPGCVVDYLFDKNGVTFLLEVKNWFLRIRDMEQLLKYYVHATEKYGENNFKLTVLVGGVESERRKILEKLGIQVFLTRDLVKEYERER